MSDDNPYTPEKTKKEEIADDLKRVGESHGAKLTIAEYQKYGEYSPSTIYRYFHTFSSALRQAGMFPVDKFNRQDITRAINKLGEKLGRPPMPQEMNKNGIYAVSSVKDEFGGYRTALSEAGYSDEEIDNCLDINPFKSADAKIEKSEGSATLDPTTTIDKIRHRLDGIGHNGIRELKKAGYSTLGELQDAHRAEIMRCEGIGRKRAVKLMMIVSSGETWESIPDNGRIDGEFLFQVMEVDRRADARKTARLYVEDCNGRELAVDIWSKHNIHQEWRESEWYALENAHGKVRELSDGTTRKQLSSTKDLTVSKFDIDFDPNAASVGNKLNPESEPHRSEVPTNEGVLESPSESTTTGQDTTATIDDEVSNENDGSEVDSGVLDEIMSDFDEI